MKQYSVSIQDHSVAQSDAYATGDQVVLSSIPTGSGNTI